MVTTSIRAMGRGETTQRARGTKQVAAACNASMFNLKQLRVKRA